MGDLSDPQVRAYLMGYAAVETFGLNEDKNEYAARMAAIGNAQGLQAEAEAIARDCEASGLQMSAGRVLKALAHFQERHATRVTYLPEQNVLMVADSYAPGDDPMELGQTLGRSPGAGSDPYRGLSGETPASSSESPIAPAIGLAAGAVTLLVLWNQFQFGTWSGIAVAVGVWIVVSAVSTALLSSRR